MVVIIKNVNLFTETPTINMLMKKNLSVSIFMPLDQFLNQFFFKLFQQNFNHFHLIYNHFHQILIFSTNRFT